MLLDLEIVSPSKLLLTRPVDMVVVPAAEGDLGVLPGHAPLIALLRGGVVAIYEGERITGRLYVGGGFVEVTPERCTLLADEVVPVAEIDKTQAAERLAAAETAYRAAENDFAGVIPALERLQAATALVEAAQTP